ncbi:RNA-binding protein [Labilithrix luteola]|uniref:RNA-binding protein n=1 Tax=Labilithrix luteola TaxID=1391654 RepID=A0A0K1QE73_9BACT|nr:RNA-binding protein [Labilithrix luteola]
MTSDALRACFAECGTVTDTHVVMDRETGRARGFAFVTMGTDAEASHAVSSLNGAMLDGRALRVNIAEERAGGGGARGGHRGW